MNRSFKVLLISIIITSFMIVTISADEITNTIIYTCDNYDITVNTNGLTDRQITNIISSFENDNDITAYGLTCTLLGHKLTAKIVRLEYHNYSTEIPHCKFEVYEIGVCERCDYTERTWLYTEWENCH